MRLGVVVISAAVGLFTAPVVLLDDVPEGLDRWSSFLSAIGGRPVEIAALILSGALFAAAAIGPLLLRRETARAAEEPPDCQHRRSALADEAAQLAADLTGFYERWDGPISGHGRILSAPDAPIDDTVTAVGEMLQEYHSKYRLKTTGVFDRLVEEGVTDPVHRSSIKRPAHPGIIQSIADLLDEAAERLERSKKQVDK